MSDDIELGQPACVLVEFIGAQVFSTLEKAIEYLVENGISPELVHVSEIYHTPMGSASREVILKVEGD